MTSPDTMVATPKGGLFEDLIEVMFAPTKVFDRSRTATAFKYALVTAVIAAAITFGTKNLVQPWYDATGDLAAVAAAKSAAASGRPMPDGMSSQIRTSTVWSVVAGVPLFMLIGPYFNALFMLIGSKLMGAKISFSQAAVVATLAGMPRLLGLLAMPVQALLADGATAKSLNDLSLGPSRFLDASTVSPALLGLAGQFDVFRMWQLALIAIGVSVVSRVSMGTAAVVAVIVAAIAAMFQLIPAALA